MSSETVKKVLGNVREQGLTAKVGHAVAKELTVEGTNVSKNGAIIPLKNTNLDWNDKGINVDIDTTVGYLNWSPNKDPLAIVFGVKNPGAEMEGKPMTIDSEHLFRKADAMMMITATEVQCQRINQANGSKKNGNGGGAK